MSLRTRMRRRGHLMKSSSRRVTLAVIIGVVIATLAGAAIARSMSTGSPVSSTTAISKGIVALDTVSARGLPIADLSLGDARALQRFEPNGIDLSEVTRLATVGDRSYYRVDRTGGPDCFALGYTASTDRLFGQVECSAEFPSEGTPLLDSTVYHGNEVWRVEGFAADGVASVALVGQDGNVLAGAPVTNNVYYFNSLPSAPIKQIVARSAIGQTLMAISVPAGFETG